MFVYLILIISNYFIIISPVGIERTYIGLQPTALPLCYRELWAVEELNFPLSSFSRM